MQTHATINTSIRWWTNWWLQELSTQNITGRLLVKYGVPFTLVSCIRFHVTAACWPSSDLILQDWHHLHACKTEAPEVRKSFNDTDTWQVWWPEAFEYKIYKNYHRYLDNWTVLLCYGQDPAFRFVKVPICSIIMAPNYSRTRHNVQSPYFIIAVVEVDTPNCCRRRRMWLASCIVSLCWIDAQLRSSYGFDMTDMSVELQQRRLRLGLFVLEI